MPIVIKNLIFDLNDEIENYIHDYLRVRIRSTVDRYIITHAIRTDSSSDPIIFAVNYMYYLQRERPISVLR
jgi:hypothetical protein